MRDALAHLGRRWRQSLQLRVVTTTMLLGLLVVSALGGVLYQQIASGLERDKIDTAQSEALALTAQAQATWDASTATSVDALDLAAFDIMRRILTAPGSNPSRYVVMSRSAGNDSDIVLASLRSGSLDLSEVSPELQAAVAASPGRQQTQMSEVTVGGENLPAVIIGSVVLVPNAGPYDLYFIYPLGQEVATMDLITNSFAIAGLTLTLLVGAVAWVVTRQVVAPVRRASEVAQRLSAGKLNERMPSRGEDDLALLATSFNAMADSLQSQIRQLEGLSAVQQRFVSDVSHELRTPLTTIRMAVDVIHDSRTGFDPSVARSAELLAGELDRFEELLADLLEISRFDAGAAALDVETVDLRSPLLRVVEATRPLADRRGSVVTLHLPDEPAEAEVDERR
ncbi:MAG TPA: histidine kinase dimerization/phospho-acceptor domain-containing protein, partial [Ornithinibacter sp.]|nr:histidine kinase dimerization/phospho-acceptor domain-containing protein [Ornithinibacter sp.]HQG17295.1 histidine kinase dimerization/phospho-acceptor domain-containing protein [Ornithinibacter sp.]